MRITFDKQLEEMHNALITMGALCESAIASAAKALLTGDPALAERASAAEREIDAKEREVEALCLNILLRQQPVARDLRKVSSALKMITDMERIGDQASDIAEISTHIDRSRTEGFFSLGDMTREAISMVTGSVDAFVRQDLQLARAVVAQDDIVDGLFSKTREDVAALIASSPPAGEYALDLLMTAKYLERIGDHAVNIAEWVEFSITGEHSGE